MKTWRHLAADGASFALPSFLVSSGKIEKIRAFALLPSSRSAASSSKRKSAGCSVYAAASALRSVGRERAHDHQAARE